jgi:hypothetical protein
MREGLVFPRGEVPVAFHGTTVDAFRQLVLRGRVPAGLIVRDNLFFEPFTAEHGARTDYTPTRADAFRTALG